MIRKRPANERGYFDHGWLKTYHSFSFGDYHDPEHHSFRSLRVINEDFVQPSKGFGTHPHKDMNILTYVISGTLEHKDSLGNGSQIQAGEWQFMSAGTGVTHSEFNPSDKEVVHLLQIWIRPNVQNLPPRYSQLGPSKQKTFWREIASSTKKAETIALDQEVSLFHAVTDVDRTLLAKQDEGIWIHMISGSLHVGETQMLPGDGLAIECEKEIKLKPVGICEFLLFYLA